MKDPQRQLERAVRLTPAGDRARHEPEWRADLAQAEALGIAPREVTRGAVRMAVRLRMRQFERVLLGGRGAMAAVTAWAGIVLLLMATCLFGNILMLASLLVVFAGAIVIMARAGTPSSWSHWLMVVSLTTGVASAWFVWWTTGLMSDAADNFTPGPAVTSWTGEALVLFLASFVGLVVSAVAAVARERRTL